MKCPICGAPSEATESRQNDLEQLRRRRECFNGHRFTTYEVHPPAISGREMVRTAKAIATRRERWVRDRAIVADPRPASAVAADFGITDARVRQIRSAAAALDAARKAREDSDQKGT